MNFLSVKTQKLWNYTDFLSFIYNLSWESVCKIIKKTNSFGILSK